MCNKQRYGQKPLIVNGQVPRFSGGGMYPVEVAQRDYRENVEYARRRAWKDLIEELKQTPLDAHPRVIAREVPALWASCIQDGTWDATWEVACSWDMLPMSDRRAYTMFAHTVYFWLEDELIRVLSHHAAG